MFLEASCDTPFTLLHTFAKPGRVIDAGSCSGFSRDTRRDRQAKHRGKHGQRFHLNPGKYGHVFHTPRSFGVVKKISGY
jgi:hypothetical protein